METGLKGKKALITGGGTGIGEGIAVALAREGVNITIATRNEYPETIKKIKTFNVGAYWVKTDVSKENDIKNMVREAINLMKGLDFYINNVGAHWDEPAIKVTTNKLLKSLKTNLLSCIWGCRESANYFIEKKSGNILIIGSTVIYGSGQDQLSYRVSKGSLKYYMETLGVELAGYGIRVNMITPGLFETRLTHGLGLMKNKDMIIKSIPLKRIGNICEDIGPAAVFLLSDLLSPYITCANLVVDGGIRFLGGETYYKD